MVLITAFPLIHLRKYSTSSEWFPRRLNRSSFEEADDTGCY